MHFKISESFCLLIWRAPILGTNKILAHLVASCFSQSSQNREMFSMIKFFCNQLKSCLRSCILHLWEKPFRLFPVFDINFYLTVIDCGVPLEVRNSRFRLLNGTTYYKSIVKYECDDNYTLVGNEMRNCTEHATWSSEEPTCKRKHVAQHQFSAD